MDSLIPERHRNDYIKFLGTAGARFVVSKQLRASGGLWFSLGGKNILVDPGPGSLLRCLKSRPKMDPVKLDGLILTHRHIDHSNDINILVEAMTNGGREQKGFLLAPVDTLEGDNPVVQKYIHRFLEKIELLQEGKIFHNQSFSLEVSMPHAHPVETYGLKFKLPYGTLSLVSDTAFFPSLIDYYKDSDILIINVVIYRDHIPENGQNKIYHLNYRQAKELIYSIKPSLAVLTHFGMDMLEHKPHLLAQQTQEELGIKVIAANDGMKLDLYQLFSTAFK